MERLHVIIKSKKKTHYAEGYYENGKVTVLKGGHICTSNAAYMNADTAVFALRDDRTAVDAKGVILKDITFDSPTAAAIFITGRSVNGYIAWRPDDKMSLKNYLKTKE